MLSCVVSVILYFSTAKVETIITPKEWVKYSNYSLDECYKFLDNYLKPYLNLLGAIFKMNITKFTYF